MKTVLKNVYYCDFCKKRYLVKWACEKHEKHCTLNQDRECGLCDIGNTRTNVREVCDKYEKKFILFEHQDEKYSWESDPTITPLYAEPFTLNDIMNDCEYCPNCVLTVIRCLGLSFWYFKNKFKYDYKAELKTFWGNAQERDMWEDPY